MLGGRYLLLLERFEQQQREGMLCPIGLGDSGDGVGACRVAQLVNHRLGGRGQLEDLLLRQQTSSLGLDAGEGEGEGDR